ncbi:hypothetical protein Golob_002080 [Gossypium lobatum]|uniref:Uncharacterized protein n=1 Tax=Gossypium lobatum TaxID=34289 RepID=A0A7J8N4D0_9ROSI|nr:hypothetical protein [Gossypium lobatum]
MCIYRKRRYEIALCMTVFEAKISPIKPRTTIPEANLEDHLSKAASK